MPLSVSHYAHAHPLTLAFFSPYENKGFCCDVCGDLGGNHWLYRCAMCEFDAHLSCGARQSSVGAQVRRSVSQPAMGDRSGGQTVIGRAFSGIVEGAAQQIGQSFVQGVVGGDDRNAGGLMDGNSEEAVLDQPVVDDDYRRAVLDSVIASIGRRAAIDLI